MRPSKLAELPSVTTLLTKSERSHGLVGTTRLHLAVGHIVLLAFATRELSGLGALGARHLMIVDGLLREFGAQYLEIVVGHLFGGHGGEFVGRDEAEAHVLAQLRILGVFQVDDTAAHTILVLHVDVLEFGVDDVLAARRQLVHVAQLGAVLDGLGQLEGLRDHFSTFEAHRVFCLRVGYVPLERVETLLLLLLFDGRWGWRGVHYVDGSLAVAVGAVGHRVREVKLGACQSYVMQKRN